MAERVFEIGLVGAGAISAGAYTAGVVDFLVHALDCWYDQKRSGGGPPHGVKLSVFSGASAGGMTAALAAGYLASDQPSIASEEHAAARKGKNKLFDAWVERIDIAQLLETRDLGDESEVREVRSLLDSSVLTSIAAEALDVTPRSNRRSYLADNFELLLTVTNLRGVPYEIALTGSRNARHAMTLHADYMHFRINDNGSNGAPDRYAMAWTDFGVRRHPVKEKLKLAALASGAFPLGLAPYVLSHSLPGDGKPDYFSARTWPRPTPFSQPHQCVTHDPIAASWNSLRKDYQYDFWCVDGGVMDNEPLELARRVIAGSAGPNKRAGKDADRALLLIDPFPNQSTFDPNYDTAAPDLVGSISGLLAALVNQARFKPAELLLAADEEIFSRFMIAPQRGNHRQAIACGALGGFGGFLQRAFRAHDYFLGRRNAQKFLRDHFTLPENNSLFDEWDANARETHCVRDADTGQPIRKDGQRFLPIVPLVGDAARVCDKPQWPHYTEYDLEVLIGRVSTRFDKLADRLVEQYFKKNNRLFRFIVKLVLRFKKGDVLRAVKAKIHDDLAAKGLMDKPAEPHD